MDDDLGSLFCYQEKLHSMATELHAAKLRANEETKRNRDSIKQLLTMLQMAYRERDEARGQLQKLLCLDKLVSSELPPVPTLSPESTLTVRNHLLGGTKAYSSTTDSSSSDTTTTTNTTLNNNNNNNDHTFSPVDSLYDVLSPLDILSPSSSDAATCLPPHYSPPIKLTATNSIPTEPTSSPEDEIIHRLAKGKPLPEKGKLLQAVMEAGPPLQTLMVAGPLPQWKNPPPVLQPLPVLLTIPTPIGTNSNGGCSLLEQLQQGYGTASTSYFGSITPAAASPFSKNQTPVTKRPRITYC